MWEHFSLAPIRLAFMTVLSLTFSILFWISLKRIRISEANAAASDETDYKEFLDSLGVGIVLFETLDRVFFVNREAARLLQSDMHSCFEKLDSNERDLFARELEATKTEKKSFELEFQISGENGERQCLMCFVGSIKELQDGIPRYVAVIQDVTLRRVAEKKVKTTQDFFHSIIQSLPNMVFVKDAKDLKFVLFNRAGEELLGYQTQDLIGKSDYSFFPREQAEYFTNKDRAVLASGKKADIQEEIIDTKFGKRFLKTKKIAMLDENGSPAYLLGISEDITEQKKAQDLIEQQQQALWVTSRFKALGEMAGSIAHEINNPLAIIDGYTNLLTQSYKDMGLQDSRINNALTRITLTVDRIKDIITGLRILSRDGTQDPFEPASIRSIVESTLSLCQTRFQVSKVDLQISQIPEDLVIDCRPVQIGQVLMNLLNNAIYAAKNASEKWVRLEVKDDGTHVTISCLDSGAGIPVDIRDKIVNPFFTTKPVGQGTGLGLSISKTIVDSHHGKFELDTRCQYTKFDVVLPKKQKGTRVLSEDAA